MDEIITMQTLSFWKAISSQVSIVSNACAAEFGAAADFVDSSSSTAATSVGGHLQLSSCAARRAHVLTALDRLVYFLTDDKLGRNLFHFGEGKGEDDDAYEAAGLASEHSAQPAASQVAKEVKSVCQLLKSPSLLDSPTERLAAYRRVKWALEKVAEFAERTISGSYNQLISPVLECLAECRDLLKSMEKDISMRELVLLLTPFTERLQTLHIQLADLLRQLRHPARVNSAQARFQLLKRLLPQLNSALQAAVQQPLSASASAAKRELLARSVELIDGIEASLVVNSESASATSAAASMTCGGIFVESGHFVVNVDELIFSLSEASRHFLRPGKLERLANSFVRHVTAVCDLLPPDQAGSNQAAAREFDELKDSLLLLLNSSEAADDAAAMSDFNGLCDSLAEQCKLIEAGVNEALVGLLVHAFNDAAVPLERLSLQLQRRTSNPGRFSASSTRAPYSDLSNTWLSSLYTDFQEKYATMTRVVKFASASCDNPKDIKEIANGMRDCERLYMEINTVISPLATAELRQQQQQQEVEFLTDLRTSWSRAVTHLTCVLDRVVDPELLLEINEDAISQVQESVTSHPQDRAVAIDSIIRGALIGRRSCEAGQRLLERRLRDSPAGGHLLPPAKNLLRQLLRSASLLRNLLPHFYSAEVEPRWHDEARFRVDLTVKCLRNLRAVAASCDDEAALARLYKELRPQLHASRETTHDELDGEENNPFLGLPSNFGAQRFDRSEAPYQRLLGLREAAEDEEAAAALEAGRLHPLAERLVAIVTATRSSPQSASADIAMATNDVSQLTSFYAGASRQLAASAGGRGSRTSSSVIEDDLSRRLEQLQATTDAMNGDAARLVAISTAGTGEDSQQQHRRLEELERSAARWSLRAEAALEMLSSVCGPWLRLARDFWTDGETDESLIHAAQQLLSGANELKACSQMAQPGQAQLLLMIRGLQQSLDSALSSMQRLRVRPEECSEHDRGAHSLNFAVAAWCLSAGIARFLARLLPPQPALQLARSVVASSSSSSGHDDEYRSWQWALCQTAEYDTAGLSAAMSLAEDRLGDTRAVADLRCTVAALRAEDSGRRLRDAGRAATEAADTEATRLAARLRFCALACVHLIRVLHSCHRFELLLSPCSRWLSAALGAACVSRDTAPLQKLFGSFGPDLSDFLTESLASDQTALDCSLQALQSLSPEIEAFRVALSKLARDPSPDVDAGEVRSLMLRSCLCSAGLCRLLDATKAGRKYRNDFQEWLDSYLNYDNRASDEAAFRRLLLQLQDEFHPAAETSDGPAAASAPYRDVRRQIEQRIRTRNLAHSLATDQERRQLLKLPDALVGDPAAVKSFNMAARVLEKEVNKWADQENWAVRLVCDIGLRLANMLGGLHEKSSNDATARALFRESELIGDDVIRIARFADIVARMCLNKEASEELHRASKSLVLPSVQLSVLTKTLDQMRDLRRKQRQLLSVVEALMSAAAQLLRCVEACSVAGIQPPDESADSETRQAALLATSWLARLQAHQAELAAQQDLTELGLRRVAASATAAVSTKGVGAVDSAAESPPSLVDLLRLGRAVDSA